MGDNVRTRATVIKALYDQIASLEALAKSLEESTVPDLREVRDLPELLQQRRAQLDLGATEVSELGDVSPNTYRALERPNSNPRLETLESVGKVLNFKIWIEML